MIESATTASEPALTRDCFATRVSYTTRALKHNDITYSEVSSTVSHFGEHILGHGYNERFKNDYKTICICKGFTNNHGNHSCGPHWVYRRVLSVGINQWVALIQQLKNINTVSPHISFFFLFFLLLPQQTSSISFWLHMQMNYLLGLFQFANVLLNKRAAESKTQMCKDGAIIWFYLVL